MTFRQQCMILAPVMLGRGHEANAAVTMPPVYCTLIINFWTAAPAAPPPLSSDGWQETSSSHLLAIIRWELPANSDRLLDVKTQVKALSFKTNYQKATYGSNSAFISSRELTSNVSESEMQRQA